MGVFTRSFIGGSVMLAFTLILRVMFNSPFLPEILAGRFFAIVPGEIESRAVLIIGVYGKYITVIVSATVLAALYGLYGVLYERFYGLLHVRENIVKRLIFSVPPWLLQTISVLILGGATQVSPLTALIYLLPSHLLYGAFLGGLGQRSIIAENVEVKRKSPTRRIFVRKIVPATVGIAILIYGIDRFLLPLLNNTETSKLSLPEIYATEVTSTDQFYRTDITLIPPSVNSVEWRLTVNGAVKKPSIYTYDQIQKLPSVKEYVTLECISNFIGGPLIGTALWEGVSLLTVLKEAGLKQEARYVVFYGEDQYSVSIPLETALKESLILAYKMNEEALNNIHGFPLRAVVPGIYGMMNAKWINKVELVSEEYLGYWQTRGWSNTAVIETTSIIMIPPGISRISGATPIAGIAFAGDRGISDVEVSTDGGKTWSKAILKDPLSNYSWLIWMTEWLPKEDGSKTITVRATDKTGKTQTSQIRGTYPEGATGFHAIDVIVEKTQVDSLQP